MIYFDSVGHKETSFALQKGKYPQQNTNITENRAFRVDFKIPSRASYQIS